MAAQDKQSGSKRPERREWLIFKKSILHTWDSVTDSYHELRKQSDLFNEIVMYIPFVCAMLFFYYTNRIAYFYHNFGNYGMEENFISSVIPVVKDLLQGHFSRLSLGLDGPLYPALLAIKTALFSQKDILKSALFLNVLFGTASLLASYYLIQVVFNRKTAVVSLILIATNAAYFEFTYTAGSASPFFFFTVFSLFIFFRNVKSMSRQSGLLFFLAGLMAGLAALTNLMGLVLLLFVVIALFAFEIAGRDASIKVKTLVWFVCGFLVVFLPALLFIHSKGAVLFTPLPLLEKTQGSLLLVHLKNLYFRLFADIGELIGWTIGAFVMLGILVMVLSDNTRLQSAFMSLGLIFFVGLAFLQHNRFYAFILLLFFIPLAANIFGSGIYKRILDKRVALGLLAVFIVLLGVNVWMNLDTIGAMAEGEPKQLMDLARYFRDHPKEKGPAIALRPLLPKRLGMEHIPLDTKIDNMQSLLAFAREKKAQYLLVDFPEYNACPYLRFLSLPQMKMPLGLKEVARKDYSALYSLDLEKLQEAPSVYSASAARARLGTWLQNPLAEISPDSVAAYIKSTFSTQNLNLLQQPAYQILTRYNVNGYELYGLLLRGIFNELIPANLYGPANAGQSPLGKQGGRPAVVLLPGEDKEGKGSILARNFAENLVRSGFYVLVMDAPGTGERVGPFSSLSAFMQYRSASGFSPAELFVTEALLGRYFMNTLNQVDRGAVHVVAIGDDCYTGVYASLLDTTIKSLTLVGGPFPFMDMVMQNYRPVKAQIKGLAGKYDFRTVMKAVKSKTGKVQCLSTNVLLNPLVEGFSRDYGFLSYPVSTDQDFVKTAFAKGIEGLCSFAQADGVSPAPAQFRGYSEQEKGLIMTIGDQAVTQNSPPLLEIFTPPEARNEIKRTASSLAPQAVVLRGILSAGRFNGLEVKRIISADKNGLPVEWREIKPPSAVPGRLMTLLVSEDSCRGDSSLITAALNKGYTISAFSLLPEVSGYADGIRSYYDALLFNLSSRDRLSAGLSILRNYYHAEPVLFCSDSLCNAAGLALSACDSGAVKTLVLNNFVGGTPEGFFGDVYDGFDGTLNASAEYVNYTNLKVSMLIRDFGNVPFETRLEEIDKKKTSVILYYLLQDEAPAAGAYGTSVVIKTGPDQLFAGE